MKYRFAIVPTADGQKMISLLAGMNYSILTKFDDELYFKFFQLRRKYS